MKHKLLFASGIYLLIGTWSAIIGVLTHDIDDEDVPQVIVAWPLYWYITGADFIDRHVRR